jgi:hypothetical protein
MAASQISHMLLQSKENLTPQCYIRTLAHTTEAFWKDIFGTYLETKLGLFHLLHRIMDTSNCDELYWKSVVKLRNALYTYFGEDEATLLKALKDGSFSKTGETLSNTDIRHL